MTAPAYWKFESISLQERVSKVSVPGPPIAGARGVRPPDATIVSIGHFTKLIALHRRRSLRRNPISCGYPTLRCGRPPAAMFPKHLAIDAFPCSIVDPQNPGFPNRGSSLTVAYPSATAWRAPTVKDAPRRAAVAAASILIWSTGWVPITASLATDPSPARPIFVTAQSTP